LGCGLVQTVNIKGGIRVIQSVSGIDDIVGYLKSNGDYLIVDDFRHTSILNSMLEYIRNSEHIIDVQMLAQYYLSISNGSEDQNLKTIMSELTDMSLDISYTNKSNRVIEQLLPGYLVKASMKTSNSHKIVFFIYNGTIPHDIRVPKHLR